MGIGLRAGIGLGGGLGAGIGLSLSSIGSQVGVWCVELELVEDYSEEKHQLSFFQFRITL